MPAEEEYVRKKITDPQVALVKMESWCAYQERCQQEVRDKLYSLGLWPDAIESVIIELIGRNFLSEERFATAFAGGKFRIKRWGKQKIKIELRKKRVPEPMIKKALLQIEDADYIAALDKTLVAKWKLEKEKNGLKKKFKILKYMISRGFEQDLVNDSIRRLFNA